MVTRPLSLGASEGASTRPKAEDQQPGDKCASRDVLTKAKVVARGQLAGQRDGNGDDEGGEEKCSDAHGPMLWLRRENSQGVANGRTHMWSPRRQRPCDGIRPAGVLERVPSGPVV